MTDSEGCVIETVTGQDYCKCPPDSWGGAPGLLDEICDYYIPLLSGMCDRCSHDKACHEGVGP